jgi:hypothetical protein
VSWIVLVTLALVAALPAGVVVARRVGPGGDETSPDAGRSPIVIHLPPGAQMRLVRERGLSYALEVDDTVRITGIGVSQMAKVAASLVDAHRPSTGTGRSSPD